MRALALMGLVFGLAATATAADSGEVRVVIQDHQFVPAELKVAAGQKIRLVVENKDASAEEFESYELNREKVVAAQASIVVFVGPLDKGRYPFFGDFHQDTARGVLVAE